MPPIDPASLTGNEKLGIQNLLASVAKSSPFPTAGDDKLTGEDIMDLVQAHQHLVSIGDPRAAKLGKYITTAGAGASMPPPQLPAALQPTQQPFGHTLASPGQYLSDPASELSRRVAGNLQPIGKPMEFISNLIQQVKQYQAQRDPNPKGYGPFPGELVQGAKVLGQGTAQQAMDYAQNPSHLLGDVLSAKIMAPEATSEAASAAMAPVDRMIPSIKRAKAAFQHLDTGLADVTAADPKFATHLDRISGTAQAVAERFNATKLKSTPPIVDKLIERATDPSSPMSWPELRQFKTDLNTLIQPSKDATEAPIPNQFRKPLMNLARQIDQGLRAGADLRGQGDVFSKANSDFRKSLGMEQFARTVGPYAGAAAGAGLGYMAGGPLGEALSQDLGKYSHAVPYLAGYLGKRAGFPLGGSIAGSLARSITEREVPPQTFPEISPSRTAAVPTSGTPAAMPNISSSKVVSRSNAIAAAKGAPAADVASALTNMGYDKKAANLAVSTASRDNPGAGFNDLFREAHAKLRGPVAETTQTNVQPSTHEILNRMAAREQAELPTRITDPAESRPGAERRVSTTPYSGPERRAPEMRGFETAKPLPQENIGIDYRPAEDLGVKVREGTEAKMGPIKRGSKALAQAKALRRERE